LRGGSACRSGAHSSPSFGSSNVAGWRREPLLTSSPRLAAVPPQLRSSVSSLVPSSTSSAQPTHAVTRVLGSVGGTMLFKSALVLLITWLVGVLSVSNAGDAVHVLLLVGLALLLLSVLRARDAAMRRAVDNYHNKK
jgi:hypothetical protein